VPKKTLDLGQALKAFVSRSKKFKEPKIKLQSTKEMKSRLAKVSADQFDEEISYLPVKNSTSPSKKI
jgi:hypothetical protein